MSKIPLIISTYHLNLKYFRFFSEILKTNWPNHPEVFVVTNKYSKQSSDTCRSFNWIETNTLDWIGNLKEGIEIIQMKYYQFEDFYLILEDQIPLLPVDQNLLDKMTAYYLLRQLKYLTFPTYRVQASIFEESEKNNNHIFKLSEKYKYYTQLQPLLAKTDYFIALLQLAIEKGISNPWEFEMINDKEDRFSSYYKWPTEQHGFLKNKRVNIYAIRFLKNNKSATWPMRQFTRYLIIQFFKENCIILIKKPTSFLPYLIKKFLNKNN